MSVLVIYWTIPRVGGSYKMMHVCPEVTQGRGMDGILPITVAEIYEAVRRHAMDYGRPLGLYRNIVDREHVVPYLAIWWIRTLIILYVIHKFDQY